MTEAIPQLSDEEYEKQAELDRRKIVGRQLSSLAVALRTSGNNIDVAASLEALILDFKRQGLVDSEESEYFWNMNRLADRTSGYVDERRAHPGLPGLSTSFPSLDDGIGGYESENIYVLNARSGAGKTTFLTQSAWELSRQATVLYVSPEARASLISQRLACFLAHVPHKLLRRGDITDAQHQRLKQAARQMRTRPIFIYDIPEVDKRQIQAAIDRVEKESGIAPQVVIVDYLQQMSGVDDFLTITNNMKSLETLAIKNRVALLMASQVGRASGDGAKLDAGKGSGKIEELASVVMSLARVKRKDAKGNEIAYPEDDVRRWLEITKNRNEGATYRFGLRFDRVTGRLEEEDFGE